MTGNPAFSDAIPLPLHFVWPVAMAAGIEKAGSLIWVPLDVPQGGRQRIAADISRAVLLVQDDELKLLVHRLAKSFEAQALTRRSTGFIRLTGGQ